MPSMESPVVSRLRIAVDETSAVGASIRKIDGVSGNVMPGVAVTMRAASAGMSPGKVVTEWPGLEMTAKFAQSRMRG